MQENGQHCRHRGAIHSRSIIQARMEGANESGVRNSSLSSGHTCITSTSRISQIVAWGCEIKLSFAPNSSRLWVERHIKTLGNP
ncbi:hypothetical protein EYC84_008336 [Monilinia fructicola]|uniref:Uncharacterized protein n=1 Tax=Monilinia fructicola TaxID=38448 RepID=A0A5M9JIS6_MONFR|nr:hypothetical protein EYC84_008336 [Monilinia fructicola]